MMTGQDQAVIGLPEQSQLVCVRQRHFVVLDVKKSTLPADPALSGISTPQHVVSLSSVEDDALGEELRVVWELEPGAHAYEKAALPPPTEFDDPARLDAFLDAVRWGAISSADDKSLQAPFRSGIEIEEYQLDPVVRALRMPRVNLLVADDVGLGKTIEAGLVAQELILRHRVRSILIVCPSSIQIQWRNQMRDKFGLEFRIVDSDLMKELRRRRGLHVNPWTHFPRLITSIDFLKRERPLRLFRETLPAEGEPIFPRRYDLMIVDEAHNVAPSGSGRYATDSLRTLAIRSLAPHFEHKLFLTATPHNGYPESFSALLELVDSQRFARGVRPNRIQLEAVMVRRMKEELTRKWDGSRRFAERKVDSLEVAYTEAERRAHQALHEYTNLRLKNAASHGEAFAAEFVLKLLKKRMFSSPEAFATTLAKHERTILGTGAGKTKPSEGVLRRQVEDIEEDYADDEEYEEATLEAVDAASRVFHEPSQQEKALLRELRDYASEASKRADSKAQHLIDWLQRTLKPNGQWNNERVLIFTEYRTTQKWLHGLLAAAGLAQGERLLTIYGGMKAEDRERIKAAFQHDPATSPVRILLATDAASEGIDLQRNCCRLIHYEIPWNPNRMEQRNGRLDRHGQRAPEVLVYHFVGRGFSASTAQTRSGDLEGDLEFLMRAVLKVETIRQDLGKVGPVIAAQVEEAMLGRRRSLDTNQAEHDAEPVRKMLKFERDLRKQLEKLHDQLTETTRELHLSPENIQKVVEIGLGLAGQPALLPAKVKGVWPDPTGQRKACSVFHLPPFKGSWALCGEGLAHPHTGDIRPIAFDSAVVGSRDDIVLAHLNHRLVQMCLRLLRGEVWSQGTHRKLYRVAARMVPSHVLREPAVIAHGRLVVLGGDNQRLHEEVIMAGGTLREGRFARMNVGETKTALDAALPDAAPDAIKKRFQALWQTIEAPLLQALEARMNERTKGLQKFLDERCASEVENITAILHELEKTIRDQLDEPTPQLEFWTAPEREQLELNMQGIRSRLAQIPGEIQHEADNLRARYRNPTPRLFPVTVTFLVPQSVAAKMGEPV
jgi:superfamily II DNA or RNA helicase